MNTTQSFGIHFTIRSDKEKDGKSPIYACITVNRKKCFFAISLPLLIFILVRCMPIFKAKLTLQLNKGFHFHQLSNSLC
jgi:hypothetical protein